MWNDLNMRDRHKFIKLAVTNGVYDLDTIHDLYDRKSNMYAVGGETIIQSQIPTEPNRPQIDVQPIIDRIRAERLVRYTAPDSALAQIKELTDNIRENEFKREFAEWINPTRNTNDYVDIRRTIPVAEARPTFINAYEKGGPKDPPKYSYQWQDDSQKYVKPSNGTQGTSSEVFSFDNPMDPWNRFNYNQGNYIKSGIVTDAIGLGLMAAPTIAPYIAKGLASPITTIASQIPQLGKYSYMLPTLDKALWATTGASGLYDRVSNEGVQGITNHPFLTAMDLGMSSPVGKGIKSSVSKSMSGLLDRTAEAMVRQGDALPNFKLWNKKGMLNYILRGEKNPELAYKSGPYSGENLINFSKNEYYSHPKDVVDAFFNKGYTMYPSNIDMEPHLQQYINMNYPNKNIKVYDLGNIFSKREIRNVNNPLIIMPQTISNGINSVDVGGHNVYPIGINPYNQYVTRGWDIWKFKGSDLVKSHVYKRGKLAKMVGDFIDSRGTPLVHTWQTHYPIKTLEQPIQQHIDENIFTPDEDFMNTILF